MSNFMEQSGYAILAMCGLVFTFALWLHSPWAPGGTRAFDGVWVRDPDSCGGPLPPDAIEVGQDLWYPWAEAQTGAIFLYDPYGYTGGEPALELEEVDSLSMGMPGRKGRAWTVTFARQEADQLTAISAGTKGSHNTRWWDVEEARQADPRLALIFASKAPYVRCREVRAAGSPGLT